MKNRPTSISIIGWMLIVMGGISLITTTVAIMRDNPIVRDLISKSPVPVPLQYVLNYLGLLICIVSGTGMLKGYKWARGLYVIWSIVAYLVGISTSPMKTAMVPGFVIFLVTTFFLFRPKANGFFSSVVKPQDT